MVNQTEEQLSRIFSALSDPTRRAILNRLAEGESTAGELAAPFEMSWPAVSKHLRVLERAGLISRQVEGRVHRCRIAPEPMDTATQWLDFHKRFWNQKLDALESWLTSQPPKKD